MPRGNSAGKNQLQQILQHLLIPSTSEIIYIAFEFEHVENLLDNFQNSSDSQIGISILDTLKITPESTDPVLTTYNFITGSPEYHEKTAGKFRFGVSKFIPTSSILESIKECIPRDRKIVIVGHSNNQDQKTAKQLGFFKEMPRAVVGVLDTTTITKELKMRHCGLLSLLCDMQLHTSIEHFHNVGNSANSTLRALILLALNRYKERRFCGMEELCPWRLIALRAVAMHERDVRIYDTLEKRDIGIDWVDWGRQVEDLNESGSMRFMERKDMEMESFGLDVVARNYLVEERLVGERVRREKEEERMCLEGLFPGLGALYSKG